MKSLKTLSYLALSAIVFSACQKDVNALKPINSAPSTDEVSNVSDEVTSEFDALLGCTRLTLRPGPQKGQDTWIDYKPDDPSYANGNAGLATQMKVLAWTIGGAPVYSRSLIRFDDLANIPAGKKIVSAKLFLYGPSSSPVYLPQGNSTYPGSPYEVSNTTLVQKVTSPWDENIVTWKTQPTITTIGQEKITASTSQWNYDVKVDVTSLIKTMLVNDGGTNYGFRLRLADESAYRSMGFYTSEASDRTKRPKLVVTYK